MDALGEVSKPSQTTNERNHGSARPSPPRPPMPYGSDKENNSISNGNTKVAKKLSNSKEKPAAPVKGPAVEGGNIQLARAGETILETFYGLLYIYHGEIKDWKLVADGYIPLCFIQEQGNANKPFKVIGVHGSVRLMEFAVTKDTKCSQNKAFIRWHDSPVKMYGVRFHREEQANQFFSAMDRMKSTLVKAAELFKQPERKAVVSQISDPTNEGISRTKISLIIKLPNKETTILTVPGLISIGELFELICKRENLDSKEHQLNLPKVGGKELNCEPDTVLGSLKIREVTVVYVGGASVSSSTSAVDEDMSSKDQQASVSLPIRPHSSDLTSHTPLTTEKASPLSQSSEQLNSLKKELVKVKRRAPPPPQQPERPKSMPPPLPRTTESSGTSPVQLPPQAKKRQAPARPPAPKIPRDSHLNKLRTTDDRLPPEFFPPAPPDDMPPPLDECEHPVSPLSDEDLHETPWIISSGENNFSSTNVTSFKDERQDVPPSDPTPFLDESRELASPESIPLKFLLPSPEKSTEDEEDVKEREGLSSRISFVGDSRSSSVDISSDIELPTSPSLDYTTPIDFQETEANDNTTEQELPNVFTDPPTSHFSSEMKNDSFFDSADVKGSTEVGQDLEIVAPPPPDFSGSSNDKFGDTDIESLMVPPPPLMFEDSPHDEIAEESNLALESKVGFSIPPPSGFEEEVTESSVESNDNSELSKKKLGLNNEMFPWMTEPQPTFKAEISEAQISLSPVDDIANSESEQSITMVQNGDYSATEALLPKKQDVEELTPHHQVTDTLQAEVPSSIYHETQSQVLESQVDDSVPGSALIVSTQQQQQQQQQQVEASKINDNTTSTSADNEHSKETKTSKDNNQNNVMITEEKETNCTVDVPIPNAENSLKVHKEKRKSTSSDEGSSNFKTPFDDLGNMETSLSSSGTSEFEDDFPDLKYLKLLDTEKCDISNVMVEKDNQAREASPISSNKATLYKEIETFQTNKTSRLPSLSTNSEGILRSNDQAVSKEPVCAEPVIESTTATSVAIPVDVVFHSLEQTKAAPETTAFPQSSGRSQNVAQRTVSSGFKTQSWADIKNQERIMEEERERKIALDRMQQQQQQQKSVNEVEKKHAQAKSHVKSVPLEEKKSVSEFSRASIADEKPLVFEEKTRAACPQTFNDQTPASSAAEGISFSLKTQNKPKQLEPHITKRHAPLSYVSSAFERKSSQGLSTFNDSFPDRNVNIPQSKRPDTSMDVDSQNTSSSYGAQGVIMRKKASTQNEDTTQKRKSIQDMMKMFSSEDDGDQQQRDVTEDAPRQSPALRLLEERMGYRERSSSDGRAAANSSSVDATMSDKQSPIGGSLDAETLGVKVGDTKPSETSVSKSNLVTQGESDRPPPENSPVNIYRKTSSSTSKDTDSFRIGPRKNSALTPKPYGVPFTREPKSISKIIKTSDVTIEAMKEVEVHRKLSNPKPHDVLFPKEQATFESTSELSSGLNASLFHSQMPNDSSVEKRKEVENKSEPVITKAQPMLEIIRQEENTNETETSVDQAYLGESKPKENLNRWTNAKSSQQVLPSKNNSEPVVLKSQPMFEMIRQDESKMKENERKWTNTKPSGQIKSSNSSVEVGQEETTVSGDNKANNNTPQPVELRKTSIADPSKRHSMPVGLMTSKSNPTHGSNLKILMAPQISDVDVVPKGRVAAMKAAWKSEDV